MVQALLAEKRYRELRNQMVGSQRPAAASASA
jgi:hypothetical protein